MRRSAGFATPWIWLVTHARRAEETRLAPVATIPAEHRATVMSAFYVVAYGSLSVPAVLAGVVVTHVGLQSTFEIFGSIVAAIAFVVAFEAWRTRPTCRTVRSRRDIAAAGRGGDDRGRLIARRDGGRARRRALSSPPRLSDPSAGIGRL
jgi:hypothetical protein